MLAMQKNKAAQSLQKRKKIVVGKKVRVREKSTLGG